MELGLEFDDSDFAEKMKEKPELKSYNANICYQQWFLSEKAEQGKNDLATLNKFRADFNYTNGKFEEAVACYKASLENLSSQNKSMRREVQESLIRCYLQTGQLRQAEEGLEQLLPDCVTDDHFCQALILKKKIYKESGNTAAEAQSIHHLIFHHPNNSNFWSDLGDLYGRQLALNDNRSHTINSDESKTEVRRTRAHLCPECSSYVEKSTATCDCTGIPGSDISNKLSSGQQEPQDSCCERDTCRSTDPSNSADTPNIEGLNLHTKIDPKDYEKANDGDEAGLFAGICPKLAILTCYSRARLLLQCVHSTVGSFIKDRNTAFVKQLEEKIQNLHLKDNVIEAAEQFVRNDLFEDDRLGETESKEQAFGDGAVTVCEFNQRWFSWATELVTAFKFRDI